MANKSLTETARDKARLLRRLHDGPAMLVMPNAWDAASARVFEASGFQAIATSSGGVAAALGFGDHEQAPAEEMLAAAARIATSVNIPVTVDFEAGYGLGQEEIVGRLVSLGAAGLNIEDSDHRSAGTVLAAEAQAERISAIKKACSKVGVDLFLNARIDVFIQRLGTIEEQAKEGVHRAKLYREAGADCVYPIFLSDEEILSEIIEAAKVVNINLRRGGPLSLNRAAGLGVRRATYATNIFREAMSYVESVAVEIKAEIDGLG